MAGSLALIGLAAGAAAFVAIGNDSGSTTGTATTVQGTTAAARPIAARSVAQTMAAAARPSFGFRTATVHTTPTPSSGSSDAVAIGDVNGDGRDDAIVATNVFTNGKITGLVAVFAQRPDGTLAPATEISYIGSANTPGLALGDLDRDGVQDIVVGHDTGISIISITDGQPQVTTVTRHDGDLDAKAVGIVDIDLDGNLDVVAQSWYRGAMMYFGDGKGEIREKRALPTPVSGSPDLKIGDVNGDGLPDLVLSSGQQRSAHFWVFPHNGRGGFSQYQAYLAPADVWGTAGVAIGDFNGDGRNDVAVNNPANSPTWAWVYHQATNGDLSSPVRMVTYDIPGAMLGADLDRDGTDELVVAHSGWSRLGVYWQDGAGALGTEQLWPVPTQNGMNPQALAVGDLNGDGCTDLAMSAYGVNLVTAMGYNCTTPPPAPAPRDINGDGKSDLLWRTQAGTHWAFWTMEGAQRTSGTAYAVGSPWRIVATGDFQGDGRIDIVWTDGYAMQMWIGNGVGFTGANMAPFPRGWRIVASDDIDGDGKADLTWRDDANTALSIWRMNSSAVIGSAAYPVGPAWTVLGSGDLDGDRRMDLVLGDGARMRLWSGTAKLGFEPHAMGAYPVGWTLDGLGDVDGDGRADLFWRYAEAGYFVIWNMDGALRMRGTTYEVPAAWHVLGSGDFDGNGMSDIVWTNGTLMQSWAANGIGFWGLPMPDYPAGWNIVD